MKKSTLCIFFSFVVLVAASAPPPDKYGLLLAPGTVTENEATLVWNKQKATNKAVYEILLNNKTTGFTGKTNYTLTGLLPSAWYTVTVRVKQSGAKESKTSDQLRFKTAARGKTFNILDYGARSDSGVKNTAAIQAAINACTEGGTVVVPKGIFVTGALYLKSGMTLRIEKDGVLKGSPHVEDYLPVSLNRFEGWEMKTYASLLNAGTLNRDGTYNVKNLRITGGGTISGGGKRLGEAMIKTGGLRSRGRLLLLMNCQNVDISNLTVTEPPCWTIHYIYSNNVTCRDLTIITNGIRNGDGIDPDSSTDCYIFNCIFDTGDDCIAIKSGKNPEGYFVAKPTKNVRITDCSFLRGHGISIGSEMSGGVSDVWVQDCKAGALLHGMQIKGTKDRGGYVKNITVADCELLQITVFSAVNYNNDGDPAPEIPVFENFVFRNIDLSKALAKSTAIDINGFEDTAHRLKNVSFLNLTLPEKAKVVVNHAQGVNFTNLKCLTGAKPEFVVSNSDGVVY